MAAVLPLPADATALASPGRARPRQSAFGKYRELIIAVAFFLLFDLGVLVLNFYTSFRISEDALAINLAGRQRMLSQRTAKVLYAIEAGRIKGTAPATDLEELRAATKLFDTSLQGFQRGATVPGGDGKPVQLNRAEGEKAAEVLDKAQSIWLPYQQLLAPLLAGAASDEQVAAAADYARGNNLRLLGLMNELTTALEATASARASNLRMVQTGGIVLALLNFAFILFKFLRRLRTSDAAIEAATEENREILQSVREGLFLLTPDFKLGSQLSLSVQALFGRPVHAGDNLLALLHSMVSDKVLSDARDYIGLLFSPHVKEQLVQGINPLSEVEIQTVNRLGAQGRRHLSFHFNRVMQGGEVRHLLVTAQDISQRMELEARLAGERSRAQKEFSMLIKAFETDPALLRQFVERAEATLLEVNDLLRSTSAASSEAQVLKAVNSAYRRIHAFKGDAGSLGLEVLSQLAHQFETELQRLKDSGAPNGEALLALPLPLEDLLTKIAAFKALTNARGTRAAPQESSALARSLVDLANRVAADLGKRVQTQVQIDPQFNAAGSRAGLVLEIAQQFVRNAVAHGIEAPATRATLGKPREGRLDVNLTPGEAGEYVLSVRDDGVGLSVERIRQRLIELHWYSAPQLAELSERQIIGHIFKPGFSTARAADRHAGRGVGLDLVQTNISRLGARLNVATMAGQFTDFKVKFS